MAGMASYSLSVIAGTAFAGDATVVLRGVAGGETTPIG